MTDQTYAPAPLRSEDITLAAVCHGLMLAGFLTSGVTSLVGVILAYVKRDTPDPIGASHYRHAIRTFWIGVIGTAVTMGILLLAVGLTGYGSYQTRLDTSGQALSFGIIAGVVTLIAAGIAIVAVQIWVAVRAIIGLIKVSSDQAIG